MIGQKVIAISPLGYKWAVEQLRSTYGPAITRLKHKSGEHWAAIVVTALAQAVPAIDRQGEPDLIVAPAASSALAEIVGDGAAFEIKSLDSGFQKFQTVAAPRRVKELNRSWSVVLMPDHVRIDLIIDELTRALAGVDAADEALRVTSAIRRRLGIGAISPGAGDDEPRLVFSSNSNPVRPLADILGDSRIVSYMTKAASKTASVDVATRHAFLVIDVLEHPFPEMTGFIYTPYLPTPSLPSGLDGLWILWTDPSELLGLSFWTRAASDWTELLLSAHGDLNNPNEPPPADFNQLAADLYASTHVKPDIGVLRFK